MENEISGHWKDTPRPLSYSADEEVELSTPWVMLLLSWVWDEAHRTVAGQNGELDLYDRDRLLCRAVEVNSLKGNRPGREVTSEKRGKQWREMVPQTVGNILGKMNSTQPHMRTQTPHTHIFVLLQVNSTTKCPGWCFHRSLTIQWFTQTARWQVYVFISVQSNNKN